MLVPHGGPGGVGVSSGVRYSERDTPVQGCLSHTKTTPPRTVLDSTDQTYLTP